MQTLHSSLVQKFASLAPLVAGRGGGGGPGWCLDWARPHCEHCLQGGLCCTGAGVCRVCRLQEATLQRAGGRRPELEQGCCGQCTLVPGVVCTEELATGKVLLFCLVWTLIGLWPSYRLLIGCQRSLLVSNCTCRGLCRAKRASAGSAPRLQRSLTPRAAGMAH